MNLKVECGIKGIVSFVLNEGTSRERVITQDNAILDSFLEKLKTFSWGGSSFNSAEKHIRIGTSNAPVDYSQLALVAPYKAKAVTSTTFDPTTIVDGVWYASTLLTTVFSVGEVVETINELGLGLQDGPAIGGIIRTRVVLNAPLEVTAEDQLTIKYTLVITGSAQDTTFNIDLDGVTYSVLSRATAPATNQFSNLTSDTPYLQCYQQSATFNGIGVGIVGATIVGKYAVGVNGDVAGQRKAIWTLETTEGNDANGIKYINWTNIRKFQFTPALNKTASKRLIFNIGYTLGRM